MKFVIDEKGLQDRIEERLAEAIKIILDKIKEEFDSNFREYDKKFKDVHSNYLKFLNAKIDIVKEQKSINEYTRNQKQEMIELVDKRFLENYEDYKDMKKDNENKSVEIIDLNKELKHKDSKIDNLSNENNYLQKTSIREINDFKIGLKRKLIERVFDDNLPKLTIKNITQDKINHPIQKYPEWKHSELYKAREEVFEEVKNMSEDERQDYLDNPKEEKMVEIEDDSKEVVENIIEELADGDENAKVKKEDIISLAKEKGISEERTNKIISEFKNKEPQKEEIQKEVGDNFEYSEDGIKEFLEFNVEESKKINEEEYYLNECFIECQFEESWKDPEKRKQLIEWTKKHCEEFGLEWEEA